MKEITAIIRRDKFAPTKRALERIACPALTVYTVEGRGKQRGRLSEIDPSLPESYEGASRILTHPTPSSYALEPQINKPVLYVPKRMISIVVPDDKVDLVVETLIKVNQSGSHGDGKIFVTPVENAWQIRTAQTSDGVLQ